VAGWILELDRGEGFVEKGNYSSWLDQEIQGMGTRKQKRPPSTKERECEAGVGLGKTRGKR